MDTEAYVSSIKRIFLTMLVLTAMVIFVSASTYEKEYAKVRAGLLEAIYEYREAFEELDKEKFDKSYVLEEELEQFYLWLNIIEEIQRSRSLYKSKYQKKIKKIEAVPKKKEKKKVAGVKLIENMKLRQLVGTACDAVVYKGSGEDLIHLPIFFKGQKVSFSSLYLVNFSDLCRSRQAINSTARNVENFGLTDLLFIKLSDGSWLVAIPKISTDILLKNYIAPFRLNWSRWGELYKKQKVKERFLSRFSEKVRACIKMSSDYYLFRPEHIDNLIFLEAQNVVHKYRSPNDISGAMDDLSQVQKTSVSMEGFSLSGFEFVIFLPLVISSLIYLLTLRTAKLRFKKQKISQPWIFTDVRGRFDQAVAWSVALFPGVSVLISYTVYLVLNPSYIKWPFYFNLCSYITCAPNRDFSKATEHYSAVLLLLFALSFPLSLYLCRDLLLIGKLWPSKTEKTLKKKWIFVFKEVRKWYVLLIKR